jgi:hypothetical protein
MKILMFGWEFPPHISGGLGTACKGLVKGLSGIPGISLTFVVPRLWGDEEERCCRLVGADQFVLKEQLFPARETGEKFEQINLPSGIVPYRTPEQFWDEKSKRQALKTRFIEITSE